MVLPNVDYRGEHSVTFTVDGVSRNTWTDWGLIPSSRHSETVNGIWSEKVSVMGLNGQEDLVRKYPYHAVNSYGELKKALRDDNRAQIKSDSGYDIFQPSSGSLSFIIADQTVSFYRKEQEILNFLHGRVASMVFSDMPGKTWTVRTTVSSFSSGAHYSTMGIGYSVLSES